MKQHPGVLVGRALVRFLLLAILIRLVRNTGVRMFYPFLPQFAQGLGITLTAAGALLTLRILVVLLAPYFGSLADRRGPRPLLILGFGLQGLALLAFGLSQGLVGAAAAMALLGISDALIHPLMQAYVSEQAPAHLRGRAIVVVEYSWAATNILILPIIGWLIDTGGWQAPFRVLPVASLAAILLLVFALPRDLPRAMTSRAPLRRQFSAILADRSATATLVANAALFMAAETFFVVWGAHLARDFALAPQQIGIIAAIIGAAELGGSVLSSLIIDRIGKRRGMMAGAGVFLVVLAAMPWLDRSLASIIAGLGLASLCIEFTVVSAIPLLAQQRPTQRATVLAMGVMVAAGVRGVTDPAATWLFDHLGFLANVMYALLTVALALWFLWRRVEERQEQP